MEFKTMVIRKLNELSENYKELQGSGKALTVNYTGMKKYIETINKSQEEMKNSVSEFWIEEQSIRNQKQARWSRGLNQWTGGQGRKKNLQKEQEKERN